MRSVRYFAPLLLLISSTAFSQESGTCRIDPDSSCLNTDPTKYCIIYTVSQGFTCPNSSPELNFVEIKRAYTVAPPFVQTTCDFESGHYRCEAWGQGPDVSYTWALNSRPGLSFVTPPHSDKVAYINCQPNGTNLVYLTVTSKFGLSTTVSTNLYCGYMGEY